MRVEDFEDFFHRRYFQDCQAADFEPQIYGMGRVLGAVFAARIRPIIENAADRCSSNDEHVSN